MPDMHSIDFPDDDETCWQCAGEGYIAMCFEEFACLHPEDGCDDCTRACDICHGKGVLK